MADFSQISGAVTGPVQPQDNPDPTKLDQPPPPPAPTAPLPNIQAPQMSQMPDPSQGGNAFSDPSQQMSMMQGQQSQAPLPPQTTESMDGPPPVQSQMPPPPQDPDDKAVDSLLAELHAQQPESVKKDQKDSDEIDSLLRQFHESNANADAQPGEGLMTWRKPGEGHFAAALRRVPEAFKTIAAEMRGRIDDNPKNMLSSFQQMFGADNVKVSGNKVMFRPEADQKFRSVDETLFTKMADFMVFNSLGALPVAANMGTQIVGDGLATAAAPALGLAAPLGFAAAGAAGGTAETLVKQGLQAITGQERQDLTKEILWNAGINAAAPIVARPLVGGAKYLGDTAAGQYVGSKIADATRYAVQKLPPVAKFADDIFNAASSSAAELAGPEAAQKLAQIRIGFNQMREQLFPESTGKTMSEVGRETMGAVEAEQKRLGARVGMVKNEALNLAEEKGTRSQMENTKKKIAEKLEPFGYYTDSETGQLLKRGERSVVYKTESVTNRIVDPTTGAVSIEESTVPHSFNFGGNKTSNVPGFDSGIEDLASYHNTIHGEGLADGGTELKNIYNDIEHKLNPGAKYGIEAKSDLEGIFKEVRGATATDRNNLMNNLFGVAGDSEEAKAWQGAYEKFSNNAEAVGRMKTLFYEPEERKIMVDSFNKAKTADRNQFIEDVAHVLGPDSKEFNMFRGSIFENLLDSSITKDGCVDATKISKVLTDPSSEEFIGKIFNKNETASLNRMAIEGQNIISRYAPNEKSMNIIVKGMETITNKLGADPRQIVKTVFGVSGSDKTIVDYMTSKGFPELMEKAQSPEIKANILKALTMTEDMVSKMRIIDIKTPKHLGYERTIKRYAPVAGPAMANFIGSKLSQFMSPQQPLPDQEPAAAPAPQSAAPTPDQTSPDASAPDDSQPLDQ